MAVVSFFLCMILFSFAANNYAGELGSATLWKSYNLSASLCDASTSQVPSNELYALASYDLFNDGAACGMICTVTCTAAIGEAGNCVADNNISVAVKIIDGISEPHPSDKTLAMRLSGPAFNKIASVNATSITINYLCE